MMSVKDIQDLHVTTWLKLVQGFLIMLAKVHTVGGRGKTIILALNLEGVKFSFAAVVVYIWEGEDGVQWKHKWLESC